MLPCSKLAGSAGLSALEKASGGGLRRAGVWHKGRRYVWLGSEACGALRCHRRVPADAYRCEATCRAHLVASYYPRPQGKGPAGLLTLRQCWYSANPTPCG